MNFNYEIHYKIIYNNKNVFYLIKNDKFLLNANMK